MSGYNRQKNIEYYRMLLSELGVTLTDELANLLPTRDLQKLYETVRHMYDMNR